MFGAIGNRSSATSHDDRFMKASRRSKTKLEVCVLLAIASFGLSRSASASHPPVQPEVQQILIDRAHARAVALGLRFGGYVLSRDGTGSWSSVCPAAVGYEDTETYPGVALADGSLVVSTGSAGIARSPDGCRWSAWHPDFPTLFSDLRANSGDPIQLFALSSTADGAGFANQLWTSTDGGASWLPHGEPLPNDLAATSFAISPSDGSRFYVASTGPHGAELLRSNDAGTSWRRFTIEHAGVPRVVAVAPAVQDAPVVMLDSHQHEAPGSALTDSIHVSLDSGEHFAALYTGTGDLTAAALSDDGRLAFGGRDDGLWIADVARGGEPERRELPQSMFVQSLAWAGALLYAGVGAPNGELSLMQSDDGGASFSRALSLCEVTPALECAGDSAVGAACSGATEAQVSLTPQALPWCSAPTTQTPTPTPPPRPHLELELGASSCGVTLPRGVKNDFGWFLTALALSLARRRRLA